MNSIARLLKKQLARARSGRRQQPVKSGSPLFRRHLTAGEADVLAGQVSRAFEAGITAEDVQEVAGFLRNAEGQMVGRVAGDVDDHVLNYYMVYYSARQRGGTNVVAHGEIGILFGGGLLMMLHALRACGSHDCALAIDPLDGYYGQSLDPITGLAISCENVERNIHQMGFDMSQVRLLRSRSESPEAMAEASKFSFASLWIDGDHSYDGVKRDWENYSNLVMPGGYVLFDNYHDGCFPGVDRFLDVDLLPHLGEWLLAVRLGRSVLLRRGK